MQRTLLLLAVLCCAACLTGGDARTSIGSAPRVASPEAQFDTFVPTDPISHPPFDSFHANWKQRLDVPYVYVEHLGPYHEATARIPGVLWEARQQGFLAKSPPFVLYFDDPAETPAAELRSRVCVPIASAQSPLTPLRYDVLPSRTVAYAFVSGSYDAVPRCYPHLFAYLDGAQWELDGPIYERYLVSPAAANTTRDLLTEVQFPIRPVR